MEHFRQRNVPLWHRLNTNPPFMSWRRSDLNEVNDWALWFFFELFEFYHFFLALKSRVNWILIKSKVFGIFSLFLKYVQDWYRIDLDVLKSIFLLLSVNHSAVCTNVIKKVDRVIISFIICTYFIDWCQYQSIIEYTGMSCVFGHCRYASHISVPWGTFVVSPL